ncbi:MAG: hypothetical protein WB392_12480 [Methanotrichaceae archaeon]
MDTASSVFWAAFGGGAAAGIFTLLAVVLTQWIRWYLDRPLIKVGVSFARLINVPGVNQKDLNISLEAKNPHNRTATLSTFGFYFKSRADGKLQIMPDGTYSFPYELQAGKSIAQFSNENNLYGALHNAGKKPSDLKCGYFTISSGQVFRGNIPRDTMKTLEDNFRSYVSKKN